MVPDRQRGSSLPEGREQKQESDLYRLRQFTVSNKRIVQRSDSLQPRRSISSVHSSASRCELIVQQHRYMNCSFADIFG